MNPSTTANYSYLTPIILFAFGVIITYIGWASKKILENIELSISKTAAKVEEHADEITTIKSDVKLHGHRLTHLEGEVVQIRKSGRMG